MTAVEAFLAAHAASAEAWSNLTRAHVSGPDAVPPGAEFWHYEAQYCWDMLATGWAEHLIPAEAREVGADYARPKVVHEPVKPMLFPVAQDWSRSGRAA